MQFASPDREKAIDYTYQILLDHHFPEPDGQCVARRKDLFVYQNAQHRELRYIRIKGHSENYGCYQEVTDHSASIFFDPAQIPKLSVDPVFVSLLALEKQMLRKNALILHCAYIHYQNKAILFSAPSGTGKTTQANLWKLYRNSQTINGDRALLRLINGQWYADGWPVCGSSEICYNRQLPIRAIVILSQGIKDEIRSLTPSEAFKMLYAQLTINSWQTKDVCHALDLLEHLLSAVLVLHLKCTISEQAVEILEQALN